MQLTGGLPQQFADQMGALLGPDFPSDIGLAVSGGGDSMAMLHLAAGWARVFGVRLHVVTIDHGLRDESAAEAAMVAAECAGLDLAHDTLKWTGWDGQGNLQEAARRARLRLIDEWRGDCAHVLMAHTRDDQAETVLMRLARGSGVDGLAGMAALRDAGGFAIVRPLLDVSRDSLRHYLTTLHIPYVDDPSNDDPTYARVRMRQLIGAEGLDTKTLTETAQRLQDARVALERRAFESASALQIHDPAFIGSVVLDRDGFASLDKETQLRILAASIQFVSNCPYRPRYAPLCDLLQRILAGGGATLQGCQIVVKGDRVFVLRELNAVAQVEIPLLDAAIWDGRVAVYCHDLNDLTVKALGQAGYDQISPKPKTGLPLPLVLSFPSLWDGPTLVACSVLGFGPDYQVSMKKGLRKFPDMLLTH